MTSEPGPTSSGELLAVWKRRARVYLFLGVAVLIFLPGGINELADNWTFFLDDLIVFLIGAIVIGLFAWARTSQSAGELTKVANLSAALFVVALIVKIAASFLEASHPDDFGNEIPGVYIMLLGIANRFV